MFSFIEGWQMKICSLFILGYLYKKYASFYVKKNGQGPKLQSNQIQKWKSDRKECIYHLQGQQRLSYLINFLLIYYYNLSLIYEIFGGR